jgi:hypothetical protein
VTLAQHPLDSLARKAELTQTERDCLADGLADSIVRVLVAEVSCPETRREAIARAAERFGWHVTD